jgi:light-regulated signal transduction histidine kinase (bacteriophytochrome)
MGAELTRFKPEYVLGLETYLERRNEISLSVGYELGRRAITEGLGLLDMALLHQDAVEALLNSASTAQRSELTRAAGDFFRELLSPFEMSLRGYRTANHELRRLNEVLAQQKEAADVINRELESFSYSVSHDLRAPLRSIDGFSQALLEDYDSQLDAQGRAYLSRIRDATQRMGHLIDDLLSLARVTRSDFQSVDVDLTSIVRMVTDRLRAVDPERRVELRIEEGVRAKGDTRLLTVLFENLLGNAWKFTSKREHARIEFGKTESAGQVTYFVRDNGAGFDMAHAEKLFGTFQRLHSASEFDGMGIGLATVQRVIHRHGGRVSGEGRVDAGATFRFTLGEAAASTSRD